MILYHASKEIVQFPEIRKARYTKDFSCGVYCTNNLRQAIRWANRASGEPIINYYNYEPNENLNILKFPDRYTFQASSSLLVSPPYPSTKYYCIHSFRSQNTENKKNRPSQM